MPRYEAMVLPIEPKPAIATRTSDFEARTFGSNFRVTTWGRLLRPRARISQTHLNTSSNGAGKPLAKQDGRRGGIIRARSSPLRAVCECGAARLRRPAFAVAKLRLRAGRGFGGRSHAQAPSRASPIRGLPPEARRAKAGGGGGIRTHGTRKGTTVFETAPFDHSGTPPSGRRRRYPKAPNPARMPGNRRRPRL